MHPSVYVPEIPPTPVNSPSIQINYACAPARPLLKTSTMRTTIKALLCSIIATACAPIGDRGDDFDGPDAGVDAGSAAATCDQIETKTMNLSVSGTAAFNGLPGKCWKLVGTLTITGSTLTSVAGLKDLREVQDLVIENTALTKIDTMSNFTVSGNVTIRNNTKLTDLSKVDAMSTLSSLTVETNAELASFGGLTKATIVTGMTKIANNPKLATLSLGSTQRLEGGLIISDNQLLGTVDMHSVNSTGAIDIRNNGNLTMLTLTGLQQVHGNLTIDNNDKLESLAGIATGINVSAPYGVWLTNNAVLKNVQSIARAVFIYGAVTINANPQLTYTSAHEIYCCADTGPVAIGGTVNQGNCGGGHYCAQCIARQ